MMVESDNHLPINLNDHIKANKNDLIQLYGICKMMLQIIMWVYCKLPEDIEVRIRKAEGERIARFTGFGFQTGEEPKTG